MTSWVVCSRINIIFRKLFEPHINIKYYSRFSIDRREYFQRKYLKHLKIYKNSSRIKCNAVLGALQLYWMYVWYFLLSLFCVFPHVLAIKTNRSHCSKLGYNFIKYFIAFLSLCWVLGIIYLKAILIHKTYAFLEVCETFSRSLFRAYCVIKRAFTVTHANISHLLTKKASSFYFKYRTLRKLLYIKHKMYDDWGRVSSTHLLISSCMSARQQITWIQQFLLCLLNTA